MTTKKMILEMVNATKKELEKINETLNKLNKKVSEFSKTTSVEDNNIVENKKILTHKNISGKVLQVNIKPNKSIEKPSKKSILMQYYIENPIEYTITNIEYYVKKMSERVKEPYQQNKQEILALVNLILKYKTKAKIQKVLKCASSTLGRCLSNLTTIGILTGSYTGNIKLNEKCLIKKY